VSQPSASGQPQIGDLGSLELLILQATPFCNINCDYCYLPNRNSKQRMTPAVIEAAMRNVVDGGLVGERLTVVWHAGEPSVLPIDYYREAFEATKRAAPAGLQLEHSFQSNGTLIDDEWCAFLRSTGARIGISVDGPARLHDARRRTRAGRGTHAQTMRGLKKLVEYGIDFHVITVLTREALRCPDELFDFYVENGISRVGFNVEEVEGTNLTSTLRGGDVDQLFSAFLRRFFDLVKANQSTFWVREMAGALSAILNPLEGKFLNQQTRPFSIVSVDVDGDFALFSPELLGFESPAYGNFALGNVHRDSIATIFKHQPRAQKMLDDVSAGVRQCEESCGYFKYCGGGAPANKYFETGTFSSSETMFCRLSIKSVLDVTLDLLEGSVQVGARS